MSQVKVGLFGGRQGYRLEVGVICCSEMQMELWTGRDMELQQGTAEPTSAGICGVLEGGDIEAGVSSVSLVREGLLRARQGCGVRWEMARSSVSAGGGAG